MYIQKIGCCAYCGKSISFGKLSAEEEERLLRQVEKNTENIGNLCKKMCSMEEEGFSKLIKSFAFKEGLDSSDYYEFAGNYLTAIA